MVSMADLWRDFASPWPPPGPEPGREPGLACVAPIQANGASLENLEKVANAILIWDGNKPGDLFKAVKTANPDVPAIVSIGTAGNWVRTRAAGSSL